MEEKILHCLKCGGAMTVKEKQSIANCSDCDALNPVPQGIYQANIKNVDWLLERYKKAVEHLNLYQFHKAYNIYDKIAKSHSDGYAFWGKVLAQYGAIFHIDQNLANQLVILRTPWERLVDNENYQKALSILDSQASALIKNEAIQMERLCQTNREILMQTEPMDVTVLVNDDESNSNNRQDLIQAELINNFLENNNLKVKFLKGIWSKQTIDQLELTILPCLELSPVLIVIDSSPEGSENQLLKNTWIRYQGLMKNDTVEKRLLISVGDPSISKSSQENRLYFPEINDANMAEIIELIQEVLAQIIKKPEPKNEIVKGLGEKLKVRQFDQAKNEIKQNINKEPDNYQLWWLFFLTKHHASSDEEIKRQGLNCEKDYYFQKAYELAPIGVRRYYYTILSECKSRITPSPEQIYDLKLAQCQGELFKYHAKRLWKPFIVFWVLTLFAYLTISLKWLPTFLGSLVVFFGCFFFIVLECYKVNKLGKIPKTISGEVAINKYYQYLKANLTPNQSAGYLPYQPYQRLQKRWKVLMVLSLVFFFGFVIKEVFIATKHWNLQYTYTFNNVVIMGGTGEEIVIPSTIGNRNVTRVASHAFYGDSKIRGVFIGEGVRELGNEAFAYCKNLRRIDLPATLRKVGEDAPFYECNDSVLLYNPTELYLSELFGVGYDEWIISIEVKTE